MRWGIETSFRTLKYTIGLLYFHSKKAEPILLKVFRQIGEEVDKVEVFIQLFVEKGDQVAVAYRYYECALGDADEFTEQDKSEDCADNKEGDIKGELEFS